MAVNFTRPSRAQVWAGLLQHCWIMHDDRRLCRRAAPAHRPLIHEVLIAAAATASLFIQAPHVFMFYTPCRLSLPSFTPPPSPHSALVHISAACAWFPCCPFSSCLSSAFACFLPCLHLWARSSTSGSVLVCRAEWRRQPAVCFFSFHFTAATWERSSFFLPYFNLNMPETLDVAFYFSCFPSCDAKILVTS